MGAGDEREGDSEVDLTSLGIIFDRIKFPDSFEMVKYFHIFTNSRDEMRFYQSDMTGIGEVEEGLEANTEVG